MRLRTANTRRKTKSPRLIKKEDIRWRKYWLQYLKPGVIFSACDLHPCYVSELDIDDNSISGVSILDGSTNHRCSLTSCGVYIMKPDEVTSYKNAWETGGQKAIEELYFGDE